QRLPAKRLPEIKPMRQLLLQRKIRLSGANTSLIPSGATIVTLPKKWVPWVPNQIWNSGSLVTSPLSPLVQLTPPSYPKDGFCSDHLSLLRLAPGVFHTQLTSAAIPQVLAIGQKNSSSVPCGKESTKV